MRMIMVAALMTPLISGAPGVRIHLVFNLSRKSQPTALPSRRSLINPVPNSKSGRLKETSVAGSGPEFVKALSLQIATPRTR